MQSHEGKRIARRCGTHDGSFHADEVTACALLTLFNQIDRDQIVRTRDEALLAMCEYVCDVGGLYDPAQHRFDHHQADYQGLWSSAGMVWAYLHTQGIVDSKTYDFFNHSLIQGIDAHDNGRLAVEAGECSFSQVIANFVPPAYNAPLEEMERAFWLAFDFTLGHLQRLLARWQYIQSCEAKVVSAMSSFQSYLAFDEAMPWMDTFFAQGGEEHPALFVIMPSGTHWKLRGIPPSLRERMQVRVPLPASWAGLLDKDLQTASGIPGAIFCHKGRFISVWQTKEDAYRALEYVLLKYQDTQ